MVKSDCKQLTFIVVLTSLIFLALGSTPCVSIADDNAEPATSTQASVRPNEAMRLFGRIEELRGEGAKIPLKMQAMTPMRDPSLDQKDMKAGSAKADTYPVDLRGTWSGELTIVSSSFDKAYFEFDRVEAERQVQLLRTGIRGLCTVSFYKGANDKTELQPCRIVFLNGSFVYALHLGDLKSGTGVTGNELSSQLMKNTLKQLAPGVLEQEVVTRDIDRNPGTKKTQIGFSESVLRFSKVDENHIYLQAASVSYNAQGKFHNKVMLYGTLTRSRG